MGIRHETSAPHTPQQNSVSERANRTIVESAHSMFLPRNVSKELWAEAIGYAVYIQNRTLSSTGKITPYEILHGRKPNISNLCIFGSPAFVHVPYARRRKVDPKAIEGILLAAARSRSHIAYGLNQEGRLKSAEM